MISSGIKPYDISRRSPFIWSPRGLLISSGIKPYDISRRSPFIWSPRGLLISSGIKPYDISRRSPFIWSPRGLLISSGIKSYDISRVSPKGLSVLESAQSLVVVFFQHCFVVSDTLRFDNSYSWVHGKTLYYEAELMEPSHDVSFERQTVGEQAEASETTRL